MWTTYVAAIVILAASAAVGAGTLRLARREPWLGYAPVVGLALLIAVAAVTIRLPGRAVTSSVVMAVLVLAGAVIAARAARTSRPQVSTALLLALVAALLATAIPFVVAGNVDVLGVGVNNDMAGHLGWADGLKVAPSERGDDIPAGYPVGPHAVMASVSETFDVDIADAATALTLGISVLAVAAAWSLLAGLPGPRRGLASVLVGLPYLGAAYYAQGAFKETLQALLLLGFMATLRDVLGRRSLDRGAAAMFVILAAGFLYNYSYVGLIWPLGTAIAALALAAFARGRLANPLAAARDALRELGESRAALAGAAAVFLLAAALIGPELARALDFFRTVGVSPSATGVIDAADLGNLPGQIPSLTALGIWPADDFRFYFQEPRSAYKAGLTGAVALAGTVVAAIWWWRREDTAVPAAAVTAAAIYVGVRLRDESPYLAAKALAVGAPIAMLFTLRALLSRWGSQEAGVRLAQAALAVAFVTLAVVSSFVALRSARVGPEAHRAELVSLRPIVDGHDVLVLTYDDFIRWELPGSDLQGPAVGLGGGVRAEKRAKALESDDREIPGDFDLYLSRALDRVDFAISTRTANRSEPPPNFRLERRGRFYELWRRSGPTQTRYVLPDEGSSNGAVLDCGSRAGGHLARQTGWARVAPMPLVARPEGQRSKSAFVPSGKSRPFSVLAEPGTYEVSMDYAALREGQLRAPNTAAQFAATLDRLGNRWRIATVRHGGGPLRLEVTTAQLPFGAKAQHNDIRELSLVSLDEKRVLVSLREACGRYVDWYTLGARRPAVRG